MEQEEKLELQNDPENRKTVRRKPAHNEGEGTEKAKSEGLKSEGLKSEGLKSEGSKSTVKRPAGQRPTGKRPASGKRPAGSGPTGDRPAAKRPQGDRPKETRPKDNRPKDNRIKETRIEENRTEENRTKENSIESRRPAGKSSGVERSPERRPNRNPSEDTDSGVERQREPERGVRREANREADRKSNREADRESNRDPRRDSDRGPYRERDRESGRERDKDFDRESDRDFDREDRPRPQNRTSPQRRRAEEESRRRQEAWEREQRQKILRRKEKERQSAKRKKILKWTLIPILCIFILFLIATMAINGYMLWVDGRYVKTPEEWKDDVRENDVECIFVLGCSVNPDQSPSAALKSRLDRAAELYKMSPHKILVSGDHSEDGYYNEVKVMKQYLIDWGIPSEDIYVDHYGFSTYDSIYRAYNTFGIRRMTIVTEEFHIYRSIFLARSFGMEADGVASKEQSENNWSLREIIARDKDFLSSVFRPDPEKTGDTISLTGSGDDTNER